MGKSGATPSASNATSITGGKSVTVQKQGQTGPVGARSDTTVVTADKFQDEELGKMVGHNETSGSSESSNVHNTATHHLEYNSMRRVMKEQRVDHETGIMTDSRQMTGLTKTQVTEMDYNSMGRLDTTPTTTDYAGVNPEDDSRGDRPTGTGRKHRLDLLA